MMITVMNENSLMKSAVYSGKISGKIRIYGGSVL